MYAQCPDTQRLLNEPSLNFELLRPVRKSAFRKREFDQQAAECYLSRIQTAIDAGPRFAQE
jgi:hypothetical protein